MSFLSWSELTAAPAEMGLSQNYEPGTDDFAPKLVACEVPRF